MAKLSPEALELRKRLLAELPPVIARKRIEYFLGGLVTKESMATYDSNRKGPENALNIGDSVAYYREDLVDWLLSIWAVTLRRDRAGLLHALAGRSGKRGRQRREPVQA